MTPAGHRSLSAGFCARRFVLLPTDSTKRNPWGAGMSTSLNSFKPQIFVAIIEHPLCPPQPRAVPHSGAWPTPAVQLLQGAVGSQAEGILIGFTAEPDRAYSRRVMKTDDPVLSAPALWGKGKLFAASWRETPEPPVPCLASFPLLFPSSHLHGSLPSWLPELPSPIPAQGFGTQGLLQTIGVKIFLLGEDLSWMEFFFFSGVESSPTPESAIKNELKNGSGFKR